MINYTYATAIHILQLYIYYNYTYTTTIHVLFLYYTQIYNTIKFPISEIRGFFSFSPLHRKAFRTYTSKPFSCVKHVSLGLGGPPDFFFILYRRASEIKVSAIRICNSFIFNNRNVVGCTRTLILLPADIIFICFNLKTGRGPMASRNSTLGLKEWVRVCWYVWD